ncbi:MAG: alpha-galactosidase [Ginsengibacter sp.]
MVIKIFTLSISFIVLMSSVSQAQQTISITTNKTALVLQTDKDSSLVVSYFGKKLNSPEEYTAISSLDKFKVGSDDLYNKHEAYVASGSLNLLEPALSVTHSNGDKSVVLKYISHNTKNIDDNQTLTSILLKDNHYNFQVTLFYHTYKKENVIEQWSEIMHNEKGNIILNKYASANLTLNGKAFYLQSHYSRAAQEMRDQEQKLSHGIFTLDSKLGTRTNLLVSSSFMVSLNKPATETDGEVIAASLQWNGNFKIDFETFDEYNLRITAGINNFASNITLKPNEVFETPKLVYTLSNNGKGEASRSLQRWARNYCLYDGNGERLTILNNWETTFFDFDDQKLSSLLQDTKKLGTDVFLLDDGWFGNKYPRNNSTAGLGDWQYNKQKLKNGIGSLAKEATVNGVKFGIWIEPEMVNPKSELYESHPDWVVREPGRKEFYMRNQLVLDLSNPAVQDFVFKSVDDLFQESPGLAFIKWDCNSLIYNAYSPYLKDQDNFYLAYTKGLNNVLARVREKYPKVPMMLCAGGGSRVDYKSLQYFTEFWPSDNTNPYDRIFIQWDYSYYFPAIAMDDHVTNMGKQPVKFKTDVAMMGKLGFDIRVNELPEKDLQYCQNAIQLYNGFKDIVWHGDQYRLQNPDNEKIASMAYVDQTMDRAVVFNYYVATINATNLFLPIKMQGLDADKKYKIEEIDLYPGTKTPIDNSRIYSGDFLMKVGFNPEVNERRSSVVLMMTSVK